MTIGPAINETACHGQVPMIDLINTDQNYQKYQVWKSKNEQAVDNTNTSSCFTPEQETLRRKQDEIARMEHVIQRQDEKIDRVDTSVAFFSKYPQANYSFQALADLYSDNALQNLLNKMEEENLRDTDPTTMHRLLYEFFKGKQELENDIKTFISACVARVAAGEQL